MYVPAERTEQCTGCGLCAVKCLNRCIQMQPDIEGFMRPVVNGEECLSCGVCRAVCPANHQPDAIPLHKAYAAYCVDEKIRYNSSSGGIFSALAESVLAAGGVVAGAAMQPDGMIRHILAETEEQLALLRGSKYVQSEAWHVFAPIQSMLDAGRTVLFSGTPCQTAALSAYLRAPAERLILIDLICHGVPSPAVWKRYVDFRSEQVGAACTDVSFRDKEESWQYYRLKMHFANGTSYAAPAASDPYLRAFLKNASLRPSCADCAFKGDHRLSDLTLADYWGVERLHPMQNAKQGVSLVLVHSEKGQQLLERCAGSLVMEETAAAPALAVNAAYTCSADASPNRWRFFAGLDRLPFDQLVRQNCADCFSERLHKLAGKVKRRMVRR